MKVWCLGIRDMRVYISLLCSVVRCLKMSWSCQLEDILSVREKPNQLSERLEMFVICHLTSSLRTLPSPNSATCHPNLAFGNEQACHFYCLSVVELFDSRGKKTGDRAYMCYLLICQRSRQTISAQLVSIVFWTFYVFFHLVPFLFGDQSHLEVSVD